MNENITYPIRVLNLFTIMDRGGAETLVMNFYRNIDRSKIQFDFMVHREERGAYDDEIESLGGRIYRMCPISVNNLYKYKGLLHSFFLEHPEYKIIHSHMSELGYFVFKEAISWNIPVRICHAHNTPVWNSGTFLQKFKRVFRVILAKKIRKLSTDFFACSRDAGKWLYGENQDFTIINNAIDAKKFAYNMSLSNQLKKKFGWSDKFVIGHVGRFNTQKNHSFLLDIFFSISSEVSNAILVLVGTGDLMDEIKRKARILNIEDKVYFMGSRDDVFNLYQAFDIFLFPSLYEGFGNVLLEAQAAGLESFTSKNVVPSEVYVTNLLHGIALSSSPNEWKNEILKYSQYIRKNTYDAIVESGYDINSNTQYLSDFYLQKYFHNKW